MPFFSFTHFIAEWIFFSLLTMLLTFAGCHDYDPCRPDTPGNKKAFQRLSGSMPPKEVRNIRAYEEFWLFDSHFCMTFYAPREIVEQILKRHEMKPAGQETDPDSISDSRFFQWDPQDVHERSEYYQYERRRKGGVVESRHLWFQPETQKCRILFLYF